MLFRSISGSTDLLKVEVVTSVLGQGRGLGSGTVSGRAHVARSTMDANNLNPGEILVVPSTSVDCIEALRRASGIITEDDDLNGHAAVIAKKLDIPAVLGVENATTLVREGAIITLDTKKGEIYSGTKSLPGEMAMVGDRNGRL